MIPSQASLQALGDPGRLKTNFLFAIQADALDCRLDVPISRLVPWQNAAPFQALVGLRKGEKPCKAPL